jgi:hypothetical protein
VRGFVYYWIDVSVAVTVGLVWAVSIGLVGRRGFSSRRAKLERRWNFCKLEDVPPRHLARKSPRAEGTRLLVLSCLIHALAGRTFRWLATLLPLP